jgi:hypothetical protein
VTARSAATDAGIESGVWTSRARCAGRSACFLACWRYSFLSESLWLSRDDSRCDLIGIITGSDVVGLAVVVAVWVGDISRRAWRLRGSGFLEVFGSSRLLAGVEEGLGDDGLEVLEKR